jgi:hypothetical protein
MLYHLGILEAWGFSMDFLGIFWGFFCYDFDLAGGEAFSVLYHFVSYLGCAQPVTPALAQGEFLDIRRLGSVNRSALLVLQL